MAAKKPYDPALMLAEIPTFKPLAKTKIPKKIGAVVDLYYKTKETRLALAKVEALIKEQESMLREHIINTVPKTDSTGAVGQLMTAKVVQKIVYRVVDWEKVYAYVKKNNAFELLQRQLSKKAVEERLEAAGKRGLPGIEEDGYVDISLSKV